MSYFVLLEQQASDDTPRSINSAWVRVWDGVAATFHLPSYRDLRDIRDITSEEFLIVFLHLAGKPSWLH
jgi:hypothetical protein